MSAHITHEEMTDLLMGARTSTLECHLQTCAGCREELERVKSSLALFRTASHAWSESESSESAAWQPVIKLPRASAHISWWKMAAVAAVMLTVFATAYRIKKNFSADSAAKMTTSQPVTTASLQDQIAEDNELLAQVNSEISEAVPMPMQPLQISAASTESSSQNKK
jgi:hypothetical protein